MIPNLTAAVMRIAVALACAATLQACSPPSQKIDEHLARAEELIEQDDDRGALVELRSALKLAPQRGDLNLRIAKILARDQKRLSDALFFYQEAYRLDPSLDEARLAAAELLATSDRAQADQLVQEVLEHDPSNARAHGLLSRLKLLERDVDGALKEALTAVELAPEDGEVQLRLGRVYQARIQMAQLKSVVPEDTVFRSAVRAFERARAAAQRERDLDGEIVAEFERARVLAAWPGRMEQAKEAYLGLIDLAGRKGDAKRVRSACDTALAFAFATADDATLSDVLERVVDRDPDHLLAWGMLAEHRRQLTGSDEEVFQRLLDRHGRNAMAHILRADALRKRGELTRAIETLEAAVGRVDDPAHVELGLAELLYTAGRGQEAAALVERMQSEAPQDYHVRLAVALRAMREGRASEAVEILTVASAERESLRAQEMLAEAHLRLGNLEAATQAADRGAQIGGERWPAGPPLRLAIGRLARDWTAVLRAAGEMEKRGQELTTEQQLAVIEALYETGREGEAQQRLDLMLAQPEASTAARLFYARREAASNPARALQVLEEGLAADPGSRVLIHRLATLEAEQGDMDRALARLDAALQGLPDDQAPGLRALRARLRARRGDLAGAEQDAVAAFRAAPQLAGIAELVAGIYIEQGRTDEAIASFEKALADGSLPRAGRSVLARFYAERGRDDEAIRLLEELVREGAAGAPVKNDLAFLLARTGRDLDRALALAQEAVAGGTEEPSFFDTLGFVYLKKGLYGPAMDQFQQAIDLAERRKEPRAEYHFHKGLALEGLERPSEAVQAFEAALALDPSFAEAGEARTSLERARAELANRPGSS